MVDRAIIVDDGVVVNIVKSDEQTATSNGWIMNDVAQIGWIESGGEFVAPPEIIAIPQVVSMAQARLALLQEGRLADVETVINSMEEPAKTSALIEWEYQTVVHRDRDLVLNVLGVGLGMIDSEIDDLFILAASL